MIKPCLFLPKEYIVHKGDVGLGMFFLYHGTVNCGHTCFTCLHSQIDVYAHHHLESTKVAHILHTLLPAATVAFSMYEQSMIHIFINKRKGRPKCFAKSPTAQDAFWLIPGLISCTGVKLGDGDSYLMLKLQSGGWPYPYGG